MSRFFLVNHIQRDQCILIPETNDSREHFFSELKTLMNQSVLLLLGRHYEHTL